MNILYKDLGIYVYSSVFYSILFTIYLSYFQFIDLIFVLLNYLLLVPLKPTEEAAPQHFEKTPLCKGATSV